MPLRGERAATSIPPGPAEGMARAAGRGCEEVAPTPRGAAAEQPQAEEDAAYAAEGDPQVGGHLAPPAGAPHPAATHCRTGAVPTTAQRWRCAQPAAARLPVLEAESVDGTLKPRDTRIKAFGRRASGERRAAHLHAARRGGERQAGRAAPPARAAAAAAAKGRIAATSDEAEARRLAREAKAAEPPPPPRPRRPSAAAAEARRLAQEAKAAEQAARQATEEAKAILRAAREAAGATEGRGMPRASGAPRRATTSAAAAFPSPRRRATGGRPARRPRRAARCRCARTRSRGSCARSCASSPTSWTSAASTPRWGSASTATCRATAASGATRCR